MNKNLIVNNLVFNFEYIDEHKVWYLGKNEFDIFNLGYFTDVTIYEDNPNWKEVINFIHYLLNDKNKIIDKLEISNERLKEVFKTLYYKLIPDLKYDDIFFTLCNVQYLGNNDNGTGFKHILSFNAESKSDADFFTYDSWNTLFEGDILVDAYKS